MSTWHCQFEIEDDLDDLILDVATVTAHSYHSLKSLAQGQFLDTDSEDSSKVREW